MSVLASLDIWGQSLARWVLWMNLWAAILLLAAILLDRALRRRVGAAWRLFLYAPLVVRLAIPLAWAAPVALVALPRADAHIAAPQQAAPAITASGPQAPPTTGSPPATSALRGSWAPISLIPPIYGAGVIVLLLLWQRDRARLRALARQSEPHPEPSAIPLLIHPSAGPLLGGALRPFIIIPRHLANDPARSLASVLRHEQAHVTRRDHWLAAAIHACVIACWPVVPLWLAATRARALMEQAADELALRGAPPERRAEYADALIDVADRLRAHRQRRLAGSLGFGRGLRARLVALATTRRWPVIAQVAVVLPLAAMLIACAGARAIEADDGPSVPGSRVQLTVLAGVPRHAALATAVQGQAPPNRSAPQPDGQAATPTLSAAELSQILASTALDGVAAQAALLLREGGMSSVRVAHPGKDSAFTDGHTFGVRIVELAEEHTVLTIDYREMSGGRSLRWHNTGPITVPAGRTAYAVATGAAGVEPHLLLITPQGATVPLADGFNPMDAAHYPVIECRLWLHRLPQRITFETLAPDAPPAPATGAFITAPKSAAGNRLSFEPPAGNRPGPIPWARTLPEGNPMDYLGSLASIAGADLISAPAVMIRPGGSARIHPDSTDMAGSSVGDHGFSIAAATEGQHVRLTVKHSLRRPGGGTVTLSTLDGWTLAPGESASWIQPPAVPGDDHWYVVTIAPRIIATKDEYPFQTATLFKGQ